jgi:hypothetical protein
MATTAEKRAWLAENGHPEIAGGRGRLTAALLDEWEAAHADYGPGVDPGDFLAADDGGQADAADYAAGVTPIRPGAEDAAAVVEEKPERPRGSRLFGRGRGAAKAKTARPGKERKRFPRVSVAPLIEDAYSDMAWAARSIPPLQRLLYAQAPISGVVLDPVVKDTVVDGALQLAARNYQRGKVGMALVGTPAALMAVLASAPQPVLENGQVAWQVAVDGNGQAIMGEDGEPVLVPRMGPASIQHQTAMLSLRYCVRAMADLSGDAIVRVQERAEENAARDDAVDQFLAFILGVPAPPADDETQKGEGAAAGLRLAGAAAGE